MPNTNPIATASTISGPRSVKMPSFFGSFGMEPHTREMLEQTSTNTGQVCRLI